MKFKVRLRGPEGTRTVEFDCTHDAQSVLEQQVYDTIAEENEWILGDIFRVPEGDARP